MAKTPEGNVKVRIKQALALLGQRCRAFMPVQGEFVEMGFPDFLCCIDGRFVSIEAKRGKSIEPTTRQKFRMEDIRAAGGVALLVHIGNIERFEDLCRSIASGSSFP